MKIVNIETPCTQNAVESSQRRYGGLGEVGKGFNSINNPYEINNHKIYEFAIPLNTLGGRSSEYLLYASVQDKDSRVVIRWPSA